MKTVKLLTQQLGENATTPRDIVGVYEEGAVDMDAEITVCVAWDNDMLTTKKKYGIVEHEIPDWMSPESYAQNCIGWKYTWGMGVDKDWPEHWQKFLYSCDPTIRYVLARLLKTQRFKSTFRSDMKKQLIAWLEMVDRIYPFPLSRKQLDCLISVYDRRESKAIQNTLYRSR